ncbi:MAG: hypothetical protein AAGJ93_09635, partial [Bacteroidota bacterium]
MRNVIAQVFRLLFILLTAMASLNATPPPLESTTNDYTFTESEITTQPGETVQICVNKNINSLSSLVRVLPVGEVVPHLSDLSSVTLYFPFLSTQQCFNLSIGTDESDGVYTLGAYKSQVELLNGTSEVMTVRVEATSHSHFICGAFTNNQVPLTEFDPSLVYDRFGNYYDHRDVAINAGGGAIVCTPGYFELTFSENFADADMIDVVCDVFAYVANQVVRRDGVDGCEVEPVRIYITDDWEGQGAAATPYYTTLSTFDIAPSRGIADSRIYTKINGGVESGASIFLDDSIFPLADGRIAINTTDLDYFYDWESGNNPSNDEVDAFTVILHEALHLLGYSAIMGGDNFIHSVWDRFLAVQTSDNPVVSQDYITGDSNENSWDPNDEIFNTHLMESCANEPCAEIEWVNESFAESIVFDPRNMNNSFPIIGRINSGTVPEGTYLNAISHLGVNDEIQDPVNYLMAPTRPEGTAFRTLGSEDISILCALGYQLDPENCNDCARDGCFNIATYDDNILNGLNSDGNSCLPISLRACAGEAIVVSPELLLGNDLSNQEDIEITNMTPRSNGTDVTGPDTDGNYTLSSTGVGKFDFQYIINSCSDFPVPKTGVFEVVFNYCAPCDNDPCENLLCVDDLEDYDVTSNVVAVLPSSHLFVEFPNNNSPDVKYNDAQENHFLHFIGGNNTAMESANLELTEGIPPGCNLYFSLEAESQLEASDLVLWGSNMPPCSPEQALIPFDCTATTSCGTYDFTPVCLGEIPLAASESFDANDLQLAEGIFTNNTDFEIRHLLVYSNNRGINIDN